MNFSKIYKAAIDKQGYHMDVAQAKLVDHLDNLYNQLLDVSSRADYLLDGLLKTFRVYKNDQATKGCYLWGDVGQGKTWLMDLFFSEAPIKSKKRFHFHEFMQHIHVALSQYSQQKDPLKAIAKSLVEETQLFCLDEFHVSDIADAMLLHGLLDEMYKRGAVFVITSNVMPDNLYKNGLQRGRFLPAIDLIKANNHILHLAGRIDYRLKNATTNSNYYCPLTPDTDLLLEERFYALAIGETATDTPISVNNRPIKTHANAKNIVWFDFDDICGGPRAAVDYIALSQEYSVVIISNIYKMDESHDDLARRFINLIDAFYDSDVDLIVSATSWPNDLYSGRRFTFEFSRTVSRLEDIRSKPLIQAAGDACNFGNANQLP